MGSARLCVLAMESWRGTRCFNSSKHLASPPILTKRWQTRPISTSSRASTSTRTRHPSLPKSSSRQETTTLPTHYENSLIQQRKKHPHAWSRDVFCLCDHTPPAGG